MEAIKTYLVRNIGNHDLSKGISFDSDLWNKADEISDFVYPWEAQQPSTSIRFKALHNNEYLCCRFQVKDSDVKVYVDKNHKKEVVYGDRVEMFLAADNNLHTYYCLEIDPTGRVFDYAASFYRKFIESWQWPAHQLHVSSQRNNEGYSILYSVSLSSLYQLTLIKNNELRVGLYRGRCMEINIENEKMQWASWVKPDSVQPDFHIPSSFGVFKLE